MNDLVTFASLDECEAVLERFIYSYAEAAQALLEIKERELWRERLADGEQRYSTFEAYVADRWQFTSGRASQLMSAGKFLRYLAVNRVNLDPPASERHFRPLVQVAKSEPDEVAWERRVEAWRVVHERAAAKNMDRLTVAFIEEVIAEYLPAKPTPPASPLTREDLENAFLLIADPGVTPAEARIRFGDPSQWRGFDDAYQWMTKTKEL